MNLLGALFGNNEEIKNASGTKNILTIEKVFK